MADIGELVVRIKADAAQLEREMKRANQVVAQNTGQMSGAFGNLKNQIAELLPVLSVAAVVEFGKGALEAADHINDLALRTGFLGSTLSALNIPLKQSGSNLDEFSASINRMNNLVGEAAKGTNQEAIRAFDDLGLSVKKLQDLSPEDQFFAIADALGVMTNQGRQTNAGMAIFGRSFASIIPLIKEAGGNLRGLTNDAKDAGNALTDEQLKRIDEFGDKWTEATEKFKLAILDLTPVLDGYIQAMNVLHDLNPVNLGSEAGRGIANIIREGRGQAPIVYDAPIGPSFKKQASAKGSNAGLIKDVNGLTDAQKQLNAAQSEANRIFDETRTPLETYTANLEKAKALLDQHLIDQDTFNRYLSEQSDILDNQLGKSLDNVQDKTAETVRVMKDSFGDALESVTFDFKNFGSAASSILDGLARDLFRSQIAQPLSNQAGGLLSSLLPSFGGFFAAGGNPPVGVPSVVGENGPELFVPKVAGTIVPNGAGGGVAVTNVFNISPGVQGTVEAEVRRMAPVISAHAQAGVFSAIERGGRESRLVGRKS